MPYLKFRTFVDSNPTYNPSAKCSKRCFNESKNCQKLKLKWYKAEESSHTTLHLFLSTAVFKNALNFRNNSTVEVEDFESFKLSFKHLEDILLYVPQKTCNETLKETFTYCFDAPIKP